MRLVLILALSSLLVGCRPPEATTGSNGVVSSGGVTVRVGLETEPAVGGAEVTVEVTEGEAAVKDAEVEIIGNMTHAGMVPVIEKAEQVEPGLYRASEFEFNMAGDWILTATVTLPNGEEISAVRALTVSSR